MDTQSSAVLAIGVAAATHDWWLTLADWVPDIAQVCITGGSLVFVTFRAINEIRKFIDARNQKQGTRRGNSELL